MGRCVLLVCVKLRAFHILKSPCSSTGPDNESLGLARSRSLSERKRALSSWPRMEPSLSTGPAWLSLRLRGCWLRTIQVICSKAVASFPFGRCHQQHHGRIRPTAPGKKGCTTPSCPFTDGLLSHSTWQRVANSLFCCGDQLVVLIANCQKLFPKAPEHRKHRCQHIARGIWQISRRVSNTQAIPFDPIIWALQLKVLDPKDTLREQEEIP